MPLRTVVSSANSRIAVSNSLIVGNTYGELTVESLSELDAIESEVAQIYGSFTTMIIISSFVLTPPHSSVREAGTRLAKKHEKNTRAVAFVVTQRGLSSVMVRTFLSAYFMMTQTEFPQQVFRSVGDAAAWLQLQPGVDPAIHEPTIEAELSAFVDQKSPPRTQRSG